MNVNFTPQALNDLEAISHYIADHNPPAAERVISRIRQTTAMFAEFPSLGRMGQVAGTREFPVPGLPYTIVYRIQSETELDILTVFHQHRQYP